MIPQLKNINFMLLTPYIVGSESLQLPRLHNILELTTPLLAPNIP